MRNKLVSLLLPGESASAKEQDLHLTADEKAVRALWKAIGVLEANLDPPTHFRAAIFGSSRVGPDDRWYAETKRLAQLLSAEGIDIVTGGGQGLMEAANVGAYDGKRKSGARSVGLSIRGALDGPPNPHLDREYYHDNFFSRLHDFYLLASAFVAMPIGGIGTMAEVALIWQLAQFGGLKDRPFILVGHMWWDYVANFMRHNMLPSGAVGPAEVHLAKLVNTVDEAFNIIRDANRRFKQQRAGG